MKKLWFKWLKDRLFSEYLKSEGHESKYIDFYFLAVNGIKLQVKNTIFSSEY